LVKGVTRRVIVIKSPDQRIFEEAIFIIREEVLKNGGVTAEDVVSEACRVATVYMKRHAGGKEKLKYLWPAVLVASGAVMTALGWLIVTIF